MRADSGFFDQALLEFLEQRGLSYIAVARMATTLKRKCAGIKEWTKERRFVVVRVRVRETRAAVGRRLLDVPGYTFRVWVWQGR